MDAGVVVGQVEAAERLDGPGYRARDLVLSFITTSGNSPNVIEGVKAAKNGDLKTIALSGKDGGRLAKEANLAITIASTNTARIQECHMAVGHLLCELTEDELE